MSDLAVDDRLTVEEREILERFARGQVPSGIAKEMYVTTASVRDTLRRLCGADTEKARLVLDHGGPLDAPEPLPDVESLEALLRAAGTVPDLAKQAVAVQQAVDQLWAAYRGEAETRDREIKHHAALKASAARINELEAQLAEARAAHEQIVNRTGGVKP